MADNRENNITKSIICILIAALGFSLMTFFVRLSGDVPTMEKAFFRNAFAAVVSFILLKREGEKFHVERRNIRDILCRCVFGTVSLIANFYAIDKIGIADANMLNKLSPFFAILLSIPILKERPRKVDVLTTTIAFLGALLIIRPGYGLTNSFPALIGLSGGFGAGLAYVYVRKLGKNGEKTPVIVLCFSLFSCAFCIPFMVPSFVMLSLKQLLFLILAGLSATVGQFGITTAYRYAPAKEISVFDYTQVVFATLLGILFLHEVPVLLSVAGYIVIIGTAVFRWRYNIYLDRKQ